MTPDEQIEELREQLAASQAKTLEAFTKAATAHSQLAVALQDLSKYSALHSALRDRFSEVARRLAATQMKLEAALRELDEWMARQAESFAFYEDERKQLAEARLDTERWDFVARHIEALVDGPGNKFGLECSLNYEANASYRQRVREHIDAAREKEQKCQSKS